MPSTVYSSRPYPREKNSYKVPAIQNKKKEENKPEETDERIKKHNQIMSESF